MGKYVVAKYIRLSMEDTKNDSLSVENQRLLLDAHIAEMCVPDAEVLEFVDNGHSGTNFERPAVQELLELVRQGKVNCIVVKDLSRFGRNMIETGYYIERVFPLFRVRFIAVSDAHDSDDYEGGTGGMEVAFKFLIHEQYSRDLSMKIKTAKRAKALNGEHVVKNCAFGFKKVDGRLEIDEPAAETVRLIFSMAADGRSLAKITARLYADKRPTPSEYKGYSSRKITKEMSCIWGKSVILDILADEQYIGVYTAGKTRKLDVGSSKVVEVDRADWIRIPNHHPAIVEKALFDTARERIDQRGEPLRKRKLGTGERYKDIKSLLQGKVFCGICGHTMKLSSTRNAAFHCDFTRVAPDAECYRLKVVASELEAVVLRQIREQARAVLKSVDDPASQTKPKTDVDGQIARIEEAKLALYEKYVVRAITAEEYQSEKIVLDTDLGHAKNAQAVLIKEAAQKASIANLRQDAEDALKAKKLSKQVLDALVERVSIYPDNRIKIAWNGLAGESTIIEVKY